jgi:hypothetical protein
MAAPYGSLEKLPSSPADGLTVASNFFLSSLSLLALPAHAHGRRGMVRAYVIIKGGVCNPVPSPAPAPAPAPAVIL